jgi:alkanesulfonate monooxygenase SsuD/methylene tetrahydromethanopterin reductase-like flavin-dependent oxidoreductase (luciferase family)
MPPSHKRQMKLGWLMSPAGNHPAAWLHPDAERRGANNFAHYVNLVRKAEAAKFDFVFQADGGGGGVAGVHRRTRSSRRLGNWRC